MNQTTKETGGAGPSHRNVEIGVAAFMALLAVIGIYGSLKVGVGWGDEGPRAGFFPFYVSLIVLGSCLINTITVFASTAKTRVFAEWSQLRQVVSVLAPTVIYVALVPYIGIYVASALLIGFFMVWFGRYSMIVSAAVAIAVPILTFLMFEIWFLVPLPKGALESMLGF